MSSSAFTPSTTTVTNNVPVNVPVVTAWEAYTPTFGAGFGAVADVSFKYRRVGDSIQVSGRWTCGTTVASTAIISLPSGLTVDLNKLGGSNFSNKLGTALRILNGTNVAPTPYSVFYDNATSNYVRIALGGDTATSPDQWSGSATVSGSLYSTGEMGLIEFTSPIAEWAGSGTTTLATRAVEEYASNSSATNADDTGTANFVYGVQGAAGILGVTTPSDMIKKRVRFTTTILSTDKIELEISADGTNWFPMIGFRDVAYSIYPMVVLGIYNNTAGSSNSSGVSYERISGSSTDIYVVFGRYQTNMPSYTNNWSSFVNYKWRVRKVSSGSQIGYPVSARNIVGDTSGSVVPVGMIGEYKYQTWSGVALSVSAYVNAATVTLTQGIWQISMQSRSGSSSGNPIAGGISTDSTPSTFSDSSGGVNYVEGYVSSVVVDSSLSITPIILNITSTTNYYAKVKASTGTLGTNAGKLVAVRIA